MCYFYIKGYEIPVVPLRMHYIEHGFPPILIIFTTHLSVLTFFVMSDLPDPHGAVVTGSIPT